jgi:hypothetical protein
LVLATFELYRNSDGLLENSRFYKDPDIYVQA